ncbi:MAG: DNA polymerase III subunit delta [Chloroflexota bacterium]
MIHVFHGDDEFSIEEAVRELRRGLGDDDFAQSNSVEFEGRDFSVTDVEGAARTVPFLADKRLVVVRGLLRRLDGSSRSRRGGGQETAEMRTEGWESLGERLKGLPDTTELVFADIFPGGQNSQLRQNGPALRVLSPAGDLQVRHFPSPRGRSVQEWIRSRATSEGVEISGPAVARMADLVGPNLRLLDQELKKLHLYARGRTVQPRDVEAMVAPAREANIFAAVDAVVERKPGLAMRHLYQLFDDGATMPYILTMLSRQTRMLILAGHLKRSGLEDRDIGDRIGLRAGFALRKTMEQAGRFDAGTLAGIHRGLLEANLDVLSGEVEERLALEMLVARLSS